MKITKKKTWFSLEILCADFMIISGCEDTDMAQTIKPVIYRERSTDYKLPASIAFETFLTLINIP